MKKWQILTVLLFLFLLSWAIRLQQNNFRTKDSAEYIQTALQIKSGAWFQKVSTPAEALKLTKRPFIYPLWLVMTGMSADYIISLLQLLFFAISMYLLLKLLESYYTKRIGLIILLCALTPSIFIYSETIMSEAIVISLITALLYVCFYKKLAHRFLKIQLLLILLAFTKPVFYPFVFINFIYWLIIYFRNRKLLYLASVLPMVLVLLYMGFNKYRTGYFHFSSISTINLVNYNVYFFDLKNKGYTEAEHYNDSLHAEAVKFTNFQEKEEFLRAEALKKIKAHVPKYALFHTMGSIRGMFDPGRFDLMTFSTKDYNDREGILNEINKYGFYYTLKKNIGNSQLWLYLFLGFIFIALLFKWLFSAYLAAHTFKNLNEYSFYFILLAGTVIFLTGPLNASRFMVPFQPALIVFAVEGYALFLKKRKREKV